MADLPTHPALQITGLSKNFAGVPALAGVDVTVGSGEVHALLGGNGSGKSTLVKVLAGVHRADAGSVSVGGRTFDARHLDAAAARQAGLRFVHQDLGLFAPMSVAENFALAEGFPTAAGGRVAWRRLHRHVQELLEKYDIAARSTTVVAELRPAVRTMVAIARALGQGGESDVVLVLDEPTASLPEQEASALLSAIRSRADQGQTIVLISHHLQEVLEVADAVTVLRDGRLAGTLDRARATEKAIVELIAGRTLTDLRQLAGESVPFGADRLTLRGVDAGPLTGVDLSVRAGEVVGLAGLLGSGRSSLLRTIFGALPLRSGSVEVAGKRLLAKAPADAVAAGVAFVPEDRVGEAAFSTLDLQENMSASVLGLFWRTGVMRSRAERRASDVLMKDFSVKAATSAAPFSSLSGGNQQKAVLARWMRREPRVLLLDEPTQGVDVVARAEIYHLIKQYTARGGAVLVASSDYDELSILCDRVVVLQGGCAVAQAVRPEITPLLLTELVQVNQNVLEGISPMTALQSKITSATVKTPPRRTGGFSALQFAERWALLGLLALVVVFFSLLPSSSAAFPTAANAGVVTGNQSVVALLALAALFPLIGGNFDFSIGGNSALCSVLCASLMSAHHVSLGVAVLAAVVLGGVIGVVNGVLVAGFGLNAFIITLGMSTLLGGVISWVTKGQTIATGISPALTDFGSSTWWGLPRLVYLVLALAVLSWYLLTHTPFGRQLYAIGANPKSARLVGIRSRRNVFLTFVIAGVLSGIAGILTTARTGGATADPGTSLLFPAIAAVFLGATAVRPGQFNVVGTIIGVLFVAASVSGLTLAGAADWVQPAFNGAALIVAVGLSTSLRRRRTGAADPT